MTASTTHTYNFPSGKKLLVRLIYEMDGPANLSYDSDSRIGDAVEIVLCKSDLEQLSDDEIVSMCRAFQARSAGMVQAFLTREEARAKTQKIRRVAIAAEARRKKRKGFVYLICGKYGDGSVYKVGRTHHDPAQRAKQIALSVPFDTELVGYIKCNDAFEFEKRLHDRLAPQRISGEWYRLDQQTVQAFCNQRGEKGCNDDA